MSHRRFYPLILLFLCSFIIDNGIIVDKGEARQAFTLLNAIRANPTKYYKELKFDKNLVVKKTQLVWNNSLAKVAEEKAYDMASRNYFSHTDPDGYGINYFIKMNGYDLNADWTRNKRDNFFESITAGAISGEEAIKTLIIDEGEPSLGHRKHLLGIGDWNASLVDIGIGFARRDSGSTFNTYITVIIAKHNW